MASAVKQVVAAGFIIFRRMQSQIEYLLLQASNGEHHWTPPKGHVDPGESEYETAIRETKEESGYSLEQLRVVPNYEKALYYTVRGNKKKVVYWLSELKNPADPVILSHEHQDFKWLGLEEACTLASFPDMITLLKETDVFIKSN